MCSFECLFRNCWLNDHEVEHCLKMYIRAQCGQEKQKYHKKEGIDILTSIIKLALKLTDGN